jgi:hypothetical protein
MPTEKPLAVGPYVPERVHIVPTGYEVDRVVRPAERLKAERVILLANLREQDRASKFREQVIAELARKGIAHEVVRAPIFELGPTLDAILRLLHGHRRDQLSVNISAGSKIQALAGCLAAMILRAEGIDVTVYYAEPERYRENPPKTPLSYGLEQIIEVAPLSLPTPPEEVRLAIRLLTKRDYHKLELALSLTQVGGLDADRVGKDGAPVDDRARVSLQAAVDQKVVQPLVRAGYASVTKVGRRSMVSLTEAGRRAAPLLTAGMVEFP